MSTGDKVTTPQHQMATRMLVTPSDKLGAMLDEWRAARPGVLELLPLGAPDPSDDLERLAAAEDEREPWFYFNEEPLPPRGADVFVFGVPAQARANGRAFPRYRISGGTAEHQRDAKWLLRALRQRAKTYEKIVAAILVAQPNLASAQSPDGVKPIDVRVIAEAIVMHESTIERATRALRMQNLHAVFGLSATRGKVALVAT